MIIIQILCFQAIKGPFLSLGSNNKWNLVLAVYVFIGSILFGNIGKVGFPYSANEIKQIL